MYSINCSFFIGQIHGSASTKIWMTASEKEPKVHRLYLSIITLKHEVNLVFDKEYSRFQNVTIQVFKENDYA